MTPRGQSILLGLVEVNVKKIFGVCSEPTPIHQTNRLNLTKASAHVFDFPNKPDIRPFPMLELSQNFMNTA